MGSLVPSWDTTAPGVPPKGWQDYDEPSSPRGRTTSQDGSKQGELTRQFSRQISMPPNLSRSSAPLPMRSLSLTRSTTIGSPGSSGRSSMQAPLSPRSPRCPASPTSPRMSSSVGGTSSRFMAKYFEMGEGEALNVQLKERWCDRVDTHVLNLRPDEEEDRNRRRSSFKQQEVTTSHALSTTESGPNVTAHVAAEGTFEEDDAASLAKRLKRISVGPEPATPTGHVQGNARHPSPPT